MTSNPEFGEKTTAQEVAKAYGDSIRGKNILITGASPGGIGAATALATASQGPGLLILTGRSAKTVTPLISELDTRFPGIKTRFLFLDLASQKSVRDAAERVNAYPENIDVLINNAGVMAVDKRTMSEDGIELQFATNHIGPFLFTNLILGKLRAAATNSTPGSVRIINLSSRGHVLSPVRFSDWNFEGKDVPKGEKAPGAAFSLSELDPGYKGYAPFVAYGYVFHTEVAHLPSSCYLRRTLRTAESNISPYSQSKTANVLFTLSLQLLLAPSNITSFSLHPGGIRSNLGRHMPENQRQALFEDPNTYWKTLDQGAATTMVAAFDPKLDSSSKGLYLSDCQFVEASEFARDKGLAEKLWRLGEEIVGEKFEARDGEMVKGSL